MAMNLPDPVALAGAPRGRTIDTIAEVLDDLAADPAHIAAVESIRPGRVRRDVQDPEYRLRSRYTASLRRFMYNPALLEVVFAEAELKTLFFRTFGYKGQTEFTVYPNAWLRDLPLLDLGQRCYLGDGIILGTNQVAVDQQYLVVDRISIGATTVFDQHCMVGYGSRVGSGCVIGARVMIGMKTRIGDAVLVRPASGVGHHCRLGNRVRIGHDVMVGAFSVVEDDVIVSDYSRIPEFSRVTRDGIVPRRAEKAQPLPELQFA